MFEGISEMFHIFRLKIFAEVIFLPANTALF